MSVLSEKILYVCKEPTEFKTTFDDDDTAIITTTAMPAFPVDPTNEKTIKTARSWAIDRYSSDLNKPHLEAETMNLVNKVQVVHLEHRGNGGRAYKVIVDDNFYVDMREDVILESMLNLGIEKGGYLNGEYVWARFGSQIKLIRKGSALYDNAVKAQEESLRKKVSAKELIIGEVYDNIQGKYIFLGFANAGLLSYKRDGWRSNRYVITKQSKGKVQLWLYVSYGEKKFSSTNDVLDYVNNHYWGVECLKSKTVYKSKDNTKHIFGDDLIDKLRETLISKITREDEVYYKFSELTMAPYPKEPNLNFKLIQKILNR